MKILHLYPNDDSLIAKHVTMLGQADTDARPDIVHVHGCWKYQTENRPCKPTVKGLASYSRLMADLNLG